MSRTDRVAALALGSNLDDRMARLRAAVSGLRAADRIQVGPMSSVYETAPVGTTGHPPYLNAVVLVTTQLDPRELIAVTQGIETANGRVRAERWGPRTLDIDVLTLGDQVSADPVVLLPHPLAHTRAFVLVPWAEVDPDGLVPGHGRVHELLEALPEIEVAEVQSNRVGPLDVAA